jgi:AraC-like DNA-binding protein
MRRVPAAEPSVLSGATKEPLPLLRIEPFEIVYGVVAHEGVDMHHAFEVDIMLAGTEVHAFEGIEITATTGDVVLIPAWEPHGWRTIGDLREECVVHFLPELLGEEAFEGLSWLSLFAARPLDRSQTRSAAARAEAVAIGRRIVDEHVERGFAWRDMIRLELARLLALLAREWPPALRDSTRSTKTGLSRVVPALEMVQTDCSRRIGMAEAAAACGFSTAHFHEVFRATMGVTFGRFAVRARLYRCAHLLLHTDLPVDSIARETGFADGSHLHRAFVNTYGCTPAEYGKRRRTKAPTR